MRRFLLIIWPIILATWLAGCDREPVRSHDATGGSSIALRVPRSLDDECDFFIDSIHAIAARISDGEILAELSQSFLINDTSPNLLSLSLPAEVPIHLTVDAFRTGLPELRGEVRRKFVIDDRGNQFTLTMLPHPEWTGTALTVVSEGKNSDGSDRADLHFHVPSSFFALWAVLTWDSSRLDVDAGSFIPSFAPVAWFPVLVHEEAALLEDFGGNFQANRAVGVVLLQDQTQQAGYHGLAGQWKVRSLLFDSTADLNAAAAGLIENSGGNPCIAQFAADHDPDRLDACISEHGGYAALLNSLREFQVLCRFGWTFAGAASSESIVRGQIVDAQSGNGLDSVDVRLSGRHNYSTMTDANGRFEFGAVLTGQYTLSATKPGFISISRSVFSGAGPVDLGRLAISAELGTSLFRVVLSWGAQPRDLDSHLWVRQYHVYYSSKGSTTQPPFDTLDVDETGGFGPETMTVVQLLDTCRYAVHQFSSDSSLAGCGATVSVYGQGATQRNYTVPSSGEGTWWYVFDILPSGQLVDHNVISSSPPVGEGLISELDRKLK